jgi:hypothetical protein
MMAKNKNSTPAKETPAKETPAEEKPATKKIDAPATKKPPVKKAALFPVEDLAGKKGLKPWYIAGLRRAAGWAPGKKVSEAEFKKAVDKFNKRPQGGGKI